MAIKNGEHDGIGYLLSNNNDVVIEKRIPLKKVHSLILDTVLDKATVQA